MVIGAMSKRFRQKWITHKHIETQTSADQVNVIVYTWQNSEIYERNSTNINENR